MRTELIATLKELASPNFQYEAWVEHKHDRPHEGQGFSFVISFLYDDTTLAENAHDTVGFILKDLQEAEAVASLVKTLNSIFEELGTRAKDEAYLHHARWSEVIEKAAEAYRIFKDNDANDPRFSLVYPEVEKIFG